VVTVEPAQRRLGHPHGRRRAAPLRHHNKQVPDSPGGRRSHRHPRNHMDAQTSVVDSR
jgi:hypothetical protein